MSSLKNFVPPSDDDDDGNGLGGGNGIGIVGGLPPGFGQGNNAAQGDDEVLQMLVNYNERFKGAEATLFRDQTSDQVLTVLIGKTKPNALLVGPAGVGKTKIAEDIARRIALGDPLIPKQLQGHTIYELPLYELVAGSGIVGELERKIKLVVDFASDPKNKVVIFIDEIHQLMQSGHGSTYGKIAEILKPAMARGDLQIIGATTTQESRTLMSDPAFERRLTQVIVDELTPEQTLVILEAARVGFTTHYQHQVVVSDSVLESIVKTADRTFRASAHRPDSALTLLDRAMAARLIDHRRLIAEANAAGDTAQAQILEQVPQLTLTEKRVQDIALRLASGNAAKPNVDIERLREELTTKLRGQNDVLESLIDRVAREALQIFPRTAPISWLFAGPSGVGKSEAGKIMSKIITGQKPITLNMAEFEHPSSITRIIGAPPGYIGSESNAELPFDSLESNPYRFIILDEFEKSDKAIQRLMLQALDEGKMTTARGRVIDFSKATIIVTTNAGRDVLDGREIGFGSASSKPISTSSLANELKKHFDAELLGRFSMIRGFNPIDRTLYAEVLTTNYTAQRAAVIEVKPRFAQMLPDALPGDAIEEMTATTFVAAHGARPAHRAVRTWIEDTLLAAQTVSAHPVVATTTDSDTL